MPNILKTPTQSSWVEVSQVFSGEEFSVVFRLNERYTPSRIYFDMYKGGELMIGGNKILPTTDYLSKYSLLDFLQGSIFLVNATGTKDSPTLGNIGSGLDYQLIYYSNQEIIDS